MIKEFISQSEDETFLIGKKIAENIKPGTVILLNGDLGSGKTVLTRGICAYFNVNCRVTSPTYTLVNEYEGDTDIYHFDIYRLSDSDELYDIGFTDYLKDDAIIIVEWANNVEKEFFGDNTISIDILRDSDLMSLKRTIKVTC